MRQTLLITLSLLFIVIACRADDKVNATEVYYCGKEERLVSQAEEIAVQRARLKAIQEKYGVFVQQIQGISMSDGRTDFASQTTSNVRGIWVKDTRPPHIKTWFEDNTIVVEAEVWGIVRELKSQGPETRIALLRNHDDERAASLDFIDGDRVYLSFKAAVDGYLAVFSRDDSVRCLVPSMHNADGLQPIKANSRYVFFDTPATKITALTDREVEANTLYVVFSTKPIIRPIADAADDGGLPVYSVDKFFDKLGKMQKWDEQLQVTPISFLIYKTETTNQ